MSVSITLGLAPLVLTFTLDADHWVFLGYFLGDTAGKKEQERKMDKFLRVLAYLGNCAALLAMIILWANNRPYGTEVLIFILLLALPVLNLAVLWQGPDLEERRLRRKLAKAELRERLKQLGVS
jgi:hypothetical protein